MRTSCPCARNRGRCPSISLLPGLSSQPEAVSPFHRWRHNRCSADVPLACEQTWLTVPPAATPSQCQEGTGHLPWCAASDAETPSQLDKCRNAYPSPITAFLHCWPLLAHHRHRQQAPEICFAGGAPPSRKSPTPRNQLGEVALEDGLASSMHAYSCTPGSYRALPSRYQEIKQHQLHFRPGERIFFPESNLGRGRSAGAGQMSSARGHF